MRKTASPIISLVRKTLRNDWRLTLLREEFAKETFANSSYMNLCAFLAGRSCRAFISPFDVFLFDQLLLDSPEKNTVVQPDVMVICDDDKIAEDGIHGAPDLVIEILSDSTAFKDLGVKKAAYEKAGVSEYWVVNPQNRSIFCYRLEAGAYLPAVELLKGTKVPSSALPGFVWEFPEIQEIKAKKRKQ